MIRSLLSLLAAAALSGCGSSPQTEELHSQRNELAQSRVAQDAMTAEIGDMRARAHATAKAGRPAPRPAAAGPADASADLAAAQPGGLRERCWQDYCPCRDPAEMSRMLCRNMREGRRVSDDALAAGAAQRDAQRILGALDADQP